MHFDARDARRLDRVEKGERRVGQGGRVEEESGEDAPGGADPVEEGTLVVRLEGLEGHAEVTGTLLEAAVDAVERLFSVDLGLSGPEQLKIRPRKAQDPERGASGASGGCRAQASSAISFGAAVRIK